MDSVKVDSISNCQNCDELESKLKDLSHSLRSPLSVLVMNFEDLKEKGTLSRDLIKDSEDCLNQIKVLLEEL